MNPEPNIPDLINGAFELTGGFVCWLNVRHLLKDRTVQGVDWRVSAFFSSWGFWNLFYYPSLHQWASFSGGVALVIANTAWVVLALRTIKRQQLAAHMEHKVFEPSCKFCQRTIQWFRDVMDDQTIEPVSVFNLQDLSHLPEIKHTYKCECDLCQDPSRLPEIKHTYKCECDLCQDRGNVN